MSDLIPVEYRTERVLTTEQLAQAYECGTDSIKRNFSNNKDHFEEGKHFFKLEGDELKDLRGKNIHLQISPKTRCLYLWTRRGASRHSKMLGTDRAWEMFDALEENYFNPGPKALTPAEQMAQGLLAAQKLLAEKDKRIEELQPKATYYDLILQCQNAIPITTIAKDYGLSAKALNKMLHDYGIQFKQGGKNGLWLLYQKYADKGYTSTRTQNFPDTKNGGMFASVHTYWTQKGRIFLYGVLKEHGVLPLNAEVDAK